MANVSSFSGDLYFRTQGKPWTFEGYLAAYDVLMSLDCSNGSYGFSMSDEESKNSAEFVAYLMAQGEDASISYWGNGRWSASGTLERFDDWTKHKGFRNEMSEETYLKNRKTFIDLMLANEWELSFEHVDEEGGIGFIIKETCIISADNKIMSGDVVTPIEPFFSFWNDVYEHGDYTLRDYSNMVEGDVRGGTHYEVVEQIAELLGVGEDGISDLSDFIIDGDWDEQLSPSPYYDELDELPEGLVEEWTELKNKGESDE